MDRLLDKLIILFICTISLSAYKDIAPPVIACLAAAAISAAIQLLDRRRSAAVLTGIISVMCFFFPVMICTMPLIFYDSLRQHRSWLMLPAAAALLSGSSLNISQTLLTFSAAAAAYIIFRRTSALEESVERLTVLRDKSKEKNIVLAEKNYRLLEAQDNAVRLATLKERNRIAREIHDNVGHMLTRSLLQSGALMIINKDEKLKKPLESLKDTLDTAMTSIRQSVHDLHDDSVDLRASIEENLRPARERFNVKTEYDAGNDIPGNIKFCVAGVVRESVSNAIKHSDGDRLSVIFREHPAFYQLLVEDNGSASEIHETGIGLKNMEDRARSVGGNIRFTPSASGFRIFMSIPKKQGEAYEDSSDRR
ncbi:MAG: sensor histidine kinase [Ruminococcus sp.]|nr:sensor histidine kinase [Ruminococcus sp.]